MKKSWLISLGVVILAVIFYGLHLSIENISLQVKFGFLSKILMIAGVLSLWLTSLSIGVKKEAWEVVFNLLISHRLGHHKKGFVFARTLFYPFLWNGTHENGTTILIKKKMLSLNVFLKFIYNNDFLLIFYFKNSLLSIISRKCSTFTAKKESIIFVSKTW